MEQSFALPVSGMDPQGDSVAATIDRVSRDANAVESFRRRCELFQMIGRIAMTDKDNGIVEFPKQPSMSLPGDGIDVLFRCVQVLANFLFVVKSKSLVDTFGPLGQSHGIIECQIDRFEIFFHLHDGNSQAFGDRVKTLRTSVFGKQVLDRDIDAQQIMQAVFEFAAIQPAQHGAAFLFLLRGNLSHQRCTKRVGKRFALRWRQF